MTRWFDLAEESEEFPPEFLARGQRYFEDERVLSLDNNTVQGLLVGRVRGSGVRAYQCLVQRSQRADGGVAIVGHCSCPVGYNCKHVVALLLAADQQAESAGGRVPRDLPMEVRTWLSRLEALAGAARPEGDFRVVYLVSREAVFGQPRTFVKAIKARRVTGGAWGKPQHFDIMGRSRARFLTPADKHILVLVHSEGVVSSGDGVTIQGSLGADVLQQIVETGCGHWREPGGPVLRWGGALAGRLGWRLGEDARLRVQIEADRPGLELLPVAPPWYLDPHSGECGPLDTGLSAEEAAVLAMAPVMGVEVAEMVTKEAEPRLRKLRLPLPPVPERRRVAAAPPVPVLRLSTDDITDLVNPPQWVSRPILSDVARLAFDYGGTRVSARDRSPAARAVVDGAVVERERDRDAEAAALRTLEETGLRREPVQPEDAGGLELAMPGGESGWLRFMQRQVPRLQAAGWRVELDPGFRFRVAQLGEWRMEIAEQEGGRWLDMALGVEVDGERIDLLPLLVDMVQRFGTELLPHTLAQAEEASTLPLRLQDGRVCLMPLARLRPILSTLVELYDPQALGRDGRLRLTRTQGAQLAEVEAADPALAWRGGEETRAWGRRLRAFEGLQPVEPPAGLAADLRPYQRRGLDWLQFLREYGLGGVLADDMGLGKTLQALAHLLLEKEHGRADRPSLVVAPTSLMFNWRREAERFAPGLRVVVLHGSERRRHFEAVGDSDLVLTTYPLLPRDFDALAGREFHLLILDEAQAVKNPRSKAAEAVRAINARHRLCLTGTPLENHLGELWALMDFLMPGMLGDERRFKRLFRNPIERIGDEHRQEQLRRRVAPFLLRRTKEEVAAELPAKTEILRQVPLAGNQRDLYETLRLSLHERVRQEVERKGFARSGIVILDALLKLRQVCCDPRLVALESARRVKGSAKLELLMDLLPELLDEGRRVLLFSQFTSMLDLIQGELIQRLRLRENEGFVKLTGRTRNRALPVDRFQAGEVPLFLISLKAGGSGLNLTAADTVIHYDPWWNPAAERQATDRAHRIGQDKPVFVYKLLTEGTVEQKVAELQARKQALADAMLAGGGAAAGSLSPEDLELLFAPASD